MAKKLIVNVKYATPPPEQNYPLGIFNSREEVELAYAPVSHHRYINHSQSAVEMESTMSKIVKSAKKSVVASTKRNTVVAKIVAKPSAKKPVKKVTAKKAAPVVERVAPIAADEKIVVLKSDKGADTLPKQAQAIIATLKAKGGKLAFTALLKALDKALDTVQGSKRIYTFYQRRLLDEGFITTKAA